RDESGLQMVWISRFFLAEGNGSEYRAAILEHLNPHCPGGPSSGYIWAQGGAICRQQLPKPFLIRRRLSSGFRPPTERLTHWMTLRASEVTARSCTIASLLLSRSSVCEHTLATGT